MSQNFLKNKIISAIRKELSEKRISLTDGINTSKKWDSIGNLNVLMKIEDEFKIKFSSNEFSSLNSVKAILKNVEKKYKKRNK